MVAQGVGEKRENWPPDAENFHVYSIPSTQSIVSTYICTTYHSQNPLCANPIYELSVTQKGPLKVFLIKMFIYLFSKCTDYLQRIMFVKIFIRVPK